MSFLDRISLIRQITNGADYQSIGKHSTAVTFFSEHKNRFAIVSNIKLAKKILNHPAFASVDHLSSFLPDAEKTGYEHIRTFLSKSPEFLNGNAHRIASVATKETIDRYMTACEQVSLNELVGDLEGYLKSATSLAAEELSKFTLSRFLTMAGREFHDTSSYIFKSSHITEEYGFFSAAPRSSKLLLLNKDIDEHIRDAGLELASANDQYMLLLLRIMGSGPLNSTLTSCINTLVEHCKDENWGDQIPPPLSNRLPFSNYLPTRFVLRRAVTGIEIDSNQFKQDDVIYLFLAQASGCPIKKLASLPFGSGCHYCPGQRVSEKIIKNCLAAIIASKGHYSCLPSEAKSNNIGAFLSFRA